MGMLYYLRIGERLYDTYYDKEKLIEAIQTVSTLFPNVLCTIRHKNNKLWKNMPVYLGGVEYTTDKVYYKITNKEASHLCQVYACEKPEEIAPILRDWHNKNIHTNLYIWKNNDWKVVQ